METTNATPDIERMFAAGAHFAYSRSKRHPSVASFIFGAKNRVELFDLEKTERLLAAAKNFAKRLGAEKKTLLFVGGKNEARDVVRSAATALGLPHVAGRWIGGTLTNFSEIRKRLNRLEELTQERARGDLTKYTKKERLLIDREIGRLEANFTGLLPLKELPAALFVIDTKHEEVAVTEARKRGIPVIGLANSDCDIELVSYPVLGNDASIASITFFVNEIAGAYREGREGA